MAHHVAESRLVGVVAATLVVLTTAVLLTPRVDRVGEIDAVVVLGGGGGERVTLGASLPEASGTPMVVYAEGIARAEAAGLRCGDAALCVWPRPSRTDGEARETLRIAQREGWDRIAVATSTFHANRARTLFRHCFDDRVDVVAVPADGDVPAFARRFAREFVAHVAAVLVRRGC